MNAVDTNVLIYSLDVDEPEKQRKAKALLVNLIGTGTVTILPWQVAGEFLNWLRKSESAGRMTGSDVVDHFHDYLKVFPLILPTADVLTTYFDLHSRFSLSHWDAMLLAACKEAGVTMLYSEDMDAATDYDGLAIVNPFA